MLQGIKVIKYNTGRELTINDMRKMHDKKVVVQMPDGCQQLFTVLDGIAFSDDIGCYYIRDGYEHLRTYFEYVE